MKKLLRAIPILLIVVGIALGGYGIYSMTLGDSQLAGEQQNKALSYKPVPDGLSYTNAFMPADKATHIGDIFGRLYVPRFGAHYVRLIGQGTVWHPVLNEIGIGHYVSSALPGEVGNFAIAAHRGGFGGSFHDIHKLTTGDLVYVETEAGWFSYEYLATKIVDPSDTSVLKPVPPELKGSTAGEKYLTMTSCTPIWVNTHRIVVWFKQIGARSRAQGPFPALAWAQKR